ncbi:hypothetical protein CNECB9_1370004 [Cupriavidus necator]|uniref:Uncharacterized protein n=1 Tax=Cupriavidus necator TaxID=106590 RepID=A0A1K0I9D6_CUPNE|nr:hypothetical protein CNECB9_1370004 [Cupriavidus necator]
MLPLPRAGEGWGEGQAYRRSTRCRYAGACPPPPPPPPKRERGANRKHDKGSGPFFRF